MTRLKGLYILNPGDFEKIYGPDERRDIANLVDIVAPVQSRENISENWGLLKDVEVIFSGWGGPRLDEKFLDAAPNLKVVFYGAGSASVIVTEASWNRGVQVTTSYAANAIPVAEYTLAMIIFGLKHGFLSSQKLRHEKTYTQPRYVPGCYKSTVGLISIGMIAKVLIELLRPFDFNIIAYDPFMPQGAASEFGIELVSLEEIFRRSDVVSLHTPWLKETENMITGAHFSSMKEGATFINTARGAVVNQPEMLEVVAKRPDLQFFLDVVHPEPPENNHPLYLLPNILFTPHIAGSLCNECHRMGRYMVDELQLFLAGKPLKWLVTRELAATSSHRPPCMKI
ncbi:TPA: glycerate dehydrogenase [Candidatus Sumerlaeota bacterium]|jgi:phosphoglycerate dehydrogenase-like enzyme|nr:glycerate dehydrogenase [Candidatus Sumerlaeota bacterium]